MISAALLLLAAADPLGALISQAKAAIGHDFRDPAAAQFRDVRAVTSSTGSPMVCGEVNAKNAFGAYAGFRRFIYSEPGRIIIEGAKAGEFDTRLLQGMWHLCDPSFRPDER